MTGSEIRHAVETYVGKSVDADIMLVAINEAIRKIGDMGLLYGEITVSEAEAGKAYYLPNDLLHVFAVFDQQGQAYEGWRVTGDQITFENPGTYTISARKLGKKMVSLSEEVDIHEAYHSAIVDYVRRFVMEAKSGDLNHKTMRFDRFEADVINTFRFLRRQRQPRVIKVVR